MINIPTERRGSFLHTRMSYLKCKVTNTGTDAAHNIAADLNIASIFSRLELYHGSNLLEQINEYGLMDNLWHDMTNSTAVRGTTSTLLEGHNFASSLRPAEVIAGNGASRVFCIPLLSVSSGCSRASISPPGT